MVESQRRPGVTSAGRLLPGGVGNQLLLLLLPAAPARVRQTRFRAGTCDLSYRLAGFDGQCGLSTYDNASGRLSFGAVAAVATWLESSARVGTPPRSAALDHDRAHTAIGRESASGTVSQIGETLRRPRVADRAFRFKSNAMKWS